MLKCQGKGNSSKGHELYEDIEDEMT